MMNFKNMQSEGSQTQRNKHYMIPFTLNARKDKQSTVTQNNSVEQIWDEVGD
jgi:hypothetical protein